MQNLNKKELKLLELHFVHTRHPKVLRTDRRMEGPITTASIARVHRLAAATIKSSHKIILYFSEGTDEPVQDAFSLLHSHLVHSK